VTAATAIAPTPIAGPRVSTIGTWVAAINGIVHQTAAQNERPSRSRRNAKPRQTSSSARPWNANRPISSQSQSGRR
jgi:hypothetical protein